MFSRSFFFENGENRELQKFGGSFSLKGWLKNTS